MFRHFHSVPRVTSSRVALAAALALFGAAAAVHADPKRASIVNLGVLPGDFWSQGSDISSNGQFALSMSCEDLLSNCSGAVWSATHGLEEIPLLPDHFEFWAVAQSGNGQAATGVSYGPGGGRAVIWTRGRGPEDLGLLPGWTEAGGFGINHAGSAIAGFAGTDQGETHAMLWTREGGLQDLGVLPGGNFGWANALSMDGKAVTGFSNGPEGEHAFLWTSLGGMEDLGSVVPGDWSAAYAIDADGTAVAGYSGPAAMRWTRAGGMQSLGFCPDGSFSVAYAMSGDGEVVGGGCDTPTTPFRASVWTEHLGQVEVSTLLSTLGVDMSEWILYVTASLDAEGTTLIGAGNYRGEDRTWIAKIPRAALHGE